MKTRKRSERGAVLVETAIVLPIFILILVGTMEFGIILHNYLILQNASREGARFGAIGNSQNAIIQRVKDYAFHLKGNSVNVTVTYPEGSERGDAVVVHASYPIPLITPLMATVTGNSTFTLQAESRMRLE